MSPPKKRRKRPRRPLRIVAKKIVELACRKHINRESLIRYVDTCLQYARADGHRSSSLMHASELEAALDRQKVFRDAIDADRSEFLETIVEWEELLVKDSRRRAQEAVKLRKKLRDG